jgi:hypothetical protein
VVAILVVLSDANPTLEMCQGPRSTVPLHCHLRGALLVAQNIQREEVAVRSVTLILSQSKRHWLTAGSATTEV